MNSMTNLSPQQLRRAADVQERILSLQNELSRLLGTARTAPAAEAPRRKKLSRKAHANIAAAARRRWAKLKRKIGGAPKRRRKLSAAARARLSAIARARWQKAKAAGRGRL